MSKDKSSVKVKVNFKKRPGKFSIVYIILLIFVSIGVGFAFYKYIYKSNIAFLAIPIIILAGIFVNLKGIINIIDLLFNLYEVKSVVCTDVEYKKDEKGNISDKYSKVYFTNHKTGENLIYTFRYKSRFNKGSAYRIVHGKYSKTYAHISR